LLVVFFRFFSWEEKKKRLNVFIQLSFFFPTEKKKEERKGTEVWKPRFLFSRKQGSYPSLTML
jgi:hypothetical protein